MPTHTHTHYASQLICATFIFPQKPIRFFTLFLCKIIIEGGHTKQHNGMNKQLAMSIKNVVPNNNGCVNIPERCLMAKHEDFAKLILSLSLCVSFCAFPTIIVNVIEMKPSEDTQTLRPREWEYEKIEANNNLNVAKNANVLNVFCFLSKPVWYFRMKS